MILAINEIELDVEIDENFPQLVREIQGPYQFDSIPFVRGDVVLDIGAHQGIVSMYLARRYPGLKIYAFEPVLDNVEKMVINLQRNKIKGVRVHPEAVTADGRDFPMLSGSHTAEASGFFDPDASGRATTVGSTTIAKILRRYRIERVRLLKLDCEGAEHEILADSAKWIERVDYVRGEIHMIPTLVQEGYTVAGTEARVPEDRAAWQVIENAALLR